MRTWPALLAWGAGLLHLALGAAIVSGAHAVATDVVLGALIVLGAAELVWGIVAIRADAPPAPRVAVAGAVVAIGMGAAALAVGGSLFAVAAATALATGAGAFAARRLRTRRAASADPGRPRPFVVPLVLGTILVAGIATPALATTDAGLHAVHDGGTMSGHAGH
ncbi:hypothetical protein ABCS02_21105 [Microbacterium sp. X-17]|uniref:hypothetical protein n=1 Tax=Microbacterium sp. X-17 TaxID=3144404 RepID=UPI0031F495FF